MQTHGNSSLRAGSLGSYLGSLCIPSSEVACIPVGPTDDGYAHSESRDMAAALDHTREQLPRQVDDTAVVADLDWDTFVGHKLDLAEAHALELPFARPSELINSARDSLMDPLVQHGALH